MSSRDNDKKSRFLLLFLYLLTVIRVHSICQVISADLLNSFLPEVWYSLVLETGELHRKETPI